MSTDERFVDRVAEFRSLEYIFFCVENLKLRKLNRLMTLLVILIKAINARDILHNRIMTYVFDSALTVYWQPHHLS